MALKEGVLATLVESGVRLAVWSMFEIYRIDANGNRLSFGVTESEDIAREMARDYDVDTIQKVFVVVSGSDGFIIRDSAEVLDAKKHMQQIRERALLKLSNFEKKALGVR